MKPRELSPFGIELDTAPTSKELRDLVLENGLVVVRDFSISSDSDLVDFASSLSCQQGALTDKLLHWDFGPLMKMQYDSEAQNYLFSAEKVPFHWDGAFHKEPLFLLFYCEESSTTGGETRFCDTQLVHRDLGLLAHSEDHDISLTYKTEKKAHYGGEVTVPLVNRHPITKKEVLKIAEPVETELNPVEMKIHNDPKGICQKVLSIVNEPQYVYTHSWKPGDLLIADNQRLIHGRHPLKTNTRRRFSRLQIL